MTKREFTKQEIYAILSRYFDLGELESYRLEISTIKDSEIGFDIDLYTLIPSSADATDFVLSTFLNTCVLYEGDGFECPVTRQIIVPYKVLDDLCILAAESDAQQIPESCESETSQIAPLSDMDEAFDLCDDAFQDVRSNMALSTSQSISAEEEDSCQSSASFLII